MIHSIIVAGAARDPGSLGVHLIEDGKLKIKKLGLTMPSKRQRTRLILSTPL